MKSSYSSLSIATTRVNTTMLLRKDPKWRALDPRNGPYLMQLKAEEDRSTKKSDSGGKDSYDSSDDRCERPKFEYFDVKMDMKYCGICHTDCHVRLTSFEKTKSLRLLEKA